MLLFSLFELQSHLELNVCRSTNMRAEEMNSSTYTAGENVISLQYSRLTYPTQRKTCKLVHKGKNVYKKKTATTTKHKAEPLCSEAR